VVSESLEPLTSARKIKMAPNLDRLSEPFLDEEGIEIVVNCGLYGKKGGKKDWR
jgi:hypothetical protein